MKIFLLAPAIAIALGACVRARDLGSPEIAPNANLVFLFLESTSEDRTTVYRLGVPPRWPHLTLANEQAWKLYVESYQCDLEKLGLEEAEFPLEQTGRELDPPLTASVLQIVTGGNSGPWVATDPETAPRVRSTKIQECALVEAPVRHQHAAMDGGLTALVIPSGETSAQIARSGRSTFVSVPSTGAAEDLFQGRYVAAVHRRDDGIYALDGQTTELLVRRGAELTVGPAIDPSKRFSDGALFGSITGELELYAFGEGNLYALDISSNPWSWRLLPTEHEGVDSEELDSLQHQPPRATFDFAWLDRGRFAGFAQLKRDGNSFFANIELEGGTIDRRSVVPGPDRVTAIAAAGEQQILFGRDGRVHSGSSFAEAMAIDDPLASATNPVWSVAPLGAGFVAGYADGRLAAYNPELGFCEVPISDDHGIREVFGFPDGKSLLAITHRVEGEQVVQNIWRVTLNERPCRR